MIKSQIRFILGFAHFQPQTKLQHKTRANNLITMTDSNLKLSDKTTRQKLTGIESPLENDVPLGRGGFINSHSGHRRYLKMVQDRQLEYVTCKKSHKTKVRLYSCRLSPMLILFIFLTNLIATHRSRGALFTNCVPWIHLRGFYRETLQQGCGMM